MIKRLLKISAITLSSLVLIGSADADVLNQRDTQNGTVTNIPDFNGTATSVTRTINVVQSEIIQDLSVTIEGLQHTWVGDLVATIQKVAPDGSTLASSTLFSRISRNGTGFGNSSNFNGNYTFASFDADPTNASNPRDLWSEADDGDSLFDIPESQASQLTASTFSQTIQNSFAAVDETDTQLSLANAFAGQTTDGQYIFSIQDAAGREVGSFTGVTLNFQSVAAVPEPSTMMVALGAIGGLFCRRRRKLHAQG